GHRPRGGGPKGPAPTTGAFAALAILGASGGQGNHPVVGIVHDAKAGTLTGALALEGHSFALLGFDEKERRVGGWAGVLAALAREGSSVHRIQWLAAALPDDGRAVHSYLNDRAVVPVESPARGSYAELLNEAGADTSRHSVLMAVQVRMGRSASRPESVSVLLRELENVRGLVADADVSCRGLLGPGSMAATIRALGQTDPPRPDDDIRPAPGRTQSCPPCLVGSPWPMATEIEWSRVRTDANWHATYWVAQWPRVDVGPDFLAPLLLGPLRRSVGVVMEPVSPARAIRAVEQARTADIADSELRRRGGFLSTARRAREAELVARREAELADGHGSYRFSGYVTVTAQSPSQLEEGCETTEHAAGQARLELRRLYGDQERALLCTLPLCRGLV
ncbi:MAG: SCO6880 family protein, partial [Actinomycetes bacterium]